MSAPEALGAAVSAPTLELLNLLRAAYDGALADEMNARSEAAANHAAGRRTAYRAAVELVAAVLLAEGQEGGRPC